MRMKNKIKKQTWQQFSEKIPIPGFISYTGWVSDANRTGKQKWIYIDLLRAKLKNESSTDTVTQKVLKCELKIGYLNVNFKDEYDRLSIKTLQAIKPISSQPKYYEYLSVGMLKAYGFSQFEFANSIWDFVQEREDRPLIKRKNFETDFNNLQIVSVMKTCTEQPSNNLYLNSIISLYCRKDKDCLENLLTEIADSLARQRLREKVYKRCIGEDRRLILSTNKSPYCSQECKKRSRNQRHYKRHRKKILLKNKKYIKEYKEVKLKLKAKGIKKQTY